MSIGLTVNMRGVGTQEQICAFCKARCSCRHRATILLRWRRGSGERLELLSEPGQPFDLIVVVRSAGLEAELQVEPVGGAHGGGRGIEIDSRLSGRNGTVEDGLDEPAAQSQPARGRAHPEPLELPGLRLDCWRKAAPGDEPGRLAVDQGHDAAAAQLQVAVRQAGGFLLKRAVAEASDTGLGQDEAAVFKQQFLGLGEGRFGSDCGNFSEMNLQGCGRARVHA